MACSHVSFDAYGSEVGQDALALHECSRGVAEEELSTTLDGRHTDLHSQCLFAYGVEVWQLHQSVVGQIAVLKCCDDLGPELLLDILMEGEQVQDAGQCVRCRICGCEEECADSILRAVVMMWCYTSTVLTSFGQSARRHRACPRQTTPCWRGLVAIVSVTR